jgi:hypothetical protein
VVAAIERDSDKTQQRRVLSLDGLGVRQGVALSSRRLVVAGFSVLELSGLRMRTSNSF